MLRSTLRPVLLLGAASPCFLPAQVQWLQPEGQVRLTGRIGGDLAHDLARGRTVLFGGIGGQGPMGETWEWNGTAWAQSFPLASPSPRHGHAMAYDQARGVVVLFGGSPWEWGSAQPFLADLWEYDGTTWTQRAFAGGPSARIAAAMTYDVARSRIVLFGGSSGGQQVPSPDAHWEWDGTSWTAGPSGPAPRVAASLAYDSLRSRTVLFGGATQCFVFSCPTLADTWEYDGTSWTQRLVASPSARHSAAATFDLARGRTVVLGGTGNCQPACGTQYDDTWEWDGTVWTQRAVTTPRLEDAAMAYDPSNARCVVFGGIDTVPFHPRWPSAETYTYDGLQWVAAAPSPMPPARNADAMAFDPVRRQMLWFGNTTTTNPGVAGTFAFDGTRWQELTPAVSPPPRSLHAMVADRARNRIVLFGGTAANGTFLGDTWEWDGLGWTQQFPAASPPAQYRHGLAYDENRAVTVLYPGAFGRNELYEYDGTTWTRRALPTMPPFRYYAGFAYDEARGNCVLFGGTLTTFQNDCWLYDGTQWIEDRSPVRPPARAYPNMAFDAARNRVVLSSGTSDNATAKLDTWEWDGAVWTERLDVGAATGRLYGALGFDRARNRLVLFGGYPGTGRFGHLHDTWELVTSCDRAGPGEVSGGGIPIACSSPPTRGQTFCVDYTNPNPNAAGLQFLLLTPGACSASPAIVPTPPGCAPSFLYGLPTEVHFQVGTQASFCFAVPNQPVFLGAVLCFQGSSLETSGCFRSTDGLTAVVR